MRRHTLMFTPVTMALVMTTTACMTDPYTGQQLQMKRGEQPKRIVTVVATTGDMVLLDTNHPLAGKDLVVEVELLEIQDANSGVTC